MKKADMVIDLQFGSTGKGLISGYLAQTRPYDTVVNANMPNAGHTYIDKNGKKFIHKVLPNGIVGNHVQNCMIGPGSVFSVEQLEKELFHAALEMANIRLVIHENAVILRPEHAEVERNTLSRISSTMQGSAAAMIEKINRVPGICAKDVLKGTSFENCVVSNNEWLEIMHMSDKILIEGAQGYSLGINAGFYPYCTSRDCTPARFLADCGVPHGFLAKVIGTLRVHPIRVGSTTDGYSGDVYPDQEELSWDDIGDSGVEPELTTVTKRKRRVFSFSMLQFHEAVLACQPDELFLNFMNYDKNKSMQVCREICKTGVPIIYQGWGPSFHNVKEFA